MKRPTVHPALRSFFRGRPAVVAADIAARRVLKLFAWHTTRVRHRHQSPMIWIFCASQRVSSSTWCCIQSCSSRNFSPRFRDTAIADYPKSIAEFIFNYMKFRYRDRDRGLFFTLIPRFRDRKLLTYQRQKQTAKKQCLECEGWHDTLHNNSIFQMPIYLLKFRHPLQYVTWPSEDLTRRRPVTT